LSRECAVKALSRKLKEELIRAGERRRDPRRGFFALTFPRAAYDSPPARAASPRDPFREAIHGPENPVRGPDPRLDAHRRRLERPVFQEPLQPQRLSQTASDRIFSIPLDPAELLVVYPAALESRVGKLRSLLDAKIGRDITFRARTG